MVMLRKEKARQAASSTQSPTVPTAGQPTRQTRIGPGGIAFPGPMRTALGP